MVSRPEIVAYKSNAAVVFRLNLSLLFFLQAQRKAQPALSVIGLKHLVSSHLASDLVTHIRAREGLVACTSANHERGHTSGRNLQKPALFRRLDETGSNMCEALVRSVKYRDKGSLCFVLSSAITRKRLVGSNHRQRAVRVEEIFNPDIVRPFLGSIHNLRVAPC